MSGPINRTAFAYSPQMGYNFKTNKGKTIDLTLKYEGYAYGNNGYLYVYNGVNYGNYGGSVGAVGIRVGYVF